MSNRIKKERRLTKLNSDPSVPSVEFWATFRKGPFPPPDELEKYEVLYPGITKLFFDNFANQSNHRMTLEKTIIEGDNKRANTAQHYSFIITLIFLIFSGFLFYTGVNVIAVGAALTSIVPVVISFINSSRKRMKERDDKRKKTGLTN